MKDKTINIPIFESDIISTVESLPRTPTEAGIIPVNLKRKTSYKNSHMVQYISVPKIIKALSTLKLLGHKYYQFVPLTMNFRDLCKENDLDGFRFIYPEDEIFETPAEELDEIRTNNKQTLENCNATLEIEPTSDYTSNNETQDNTLEDEIEKEEEEYVKRMQCVDGNSNTTVRFVSAIIILK